jgi:thiol-disulfide isomerase/thioredoxin
MKRFIFAGIVAVMLLAGVGSVFAQAQSVPKSVDLYFFWGDGCPHCAEEEKLLEQLKDKYPTLTVHDYEVWYSAENAKLMQDIGTALDISISGVPFTAVGDMYVAGYLNDETTGAAIEAKIKECIQQECADTIEPVINAVRENSGNDNNERRTSFSVPDEFTFPLIGTVRVKNLSLPFLTTVFGLIDGFNPCAMWVLVFLIGLLLEMNDRRRMWVLGSSFILISGVVYFVFMAAWLNALLFVGYVAWVRAAIALVALAGGAWSLKEYFSKKEIVCVVEASDRKKGIIERLKAVTRTKNFWLALAGIVALAASVNLVELFCSAGLPAAYTQILTLSELPSLSYYLYLLLYIFFYMLDDMVIFVIAMVTFRLTGLSGKYVRLSRLIGGVLMVAIGLLLLLKPQWLMFG